MLRAAHFCQIVLQCLHKPWEWPLLIGQFLMLSKEVKQLKSCFSVIFWATLKPGNRNPESETGIRNRKPESRIGNRNPETGDHKSQKKFAKLIFICIAFAGKNKRLWARKVTHRMISKSHDNKQNFVKCLNQQSHHDDWCKQNLLMRSDEMFDQVMCNKVKRTAFEN